MASRKITTAKMKRVVLESPFAGDVKKHEAYARLCLRDCLSRGESPIASHLLLTQEGVLEDADPQQRMMGIEAGLSWLEVADEQVFYIDFGYSSGMEYAKERGCLLGVKQTERKLFQGDAKYRSIEQYEFEKKFNHDTKSEEIQKQFEDRLMKESIRQRIF